MKYNSGFNVSALIEHANKLWNMTLDICYVGCILLGGFTLSTSTMSISALAVAHEPRERAQTL